MAYGYGYYPRSEYGADLPEIADTDRAVSRAVEIVRDPAVHPASGPAGAPGRWRRAPAADTPGNRVRAA